MERIAERKRQPGELRTTKYAKNTKGEKLGRGRKNTAGARQTLRGRAAIKGGIDKIMGGWEAEENPLISLIFANFSGGD
jgi:hypothetical protein